MMTKLTIFYVATLLCCLAAYLPDNVDAELDSETIRHLREYLQFREQLARRGLQEPVAAEEQLDEPLEALAQDNREINEPAETWGTYKYDVIAKPAEERDSNLRGFEESHVEHPQYVQQEPYQLEGENPSPVRSFPEDVYSDQYRETVEVLESRVVDQELDELADSNDVELDGDALPIEIDFRGTGWTGRPRNRTAARKGLYKEKVSQAEKYENAAGEASVVITLASDARKLLVTKPARFAHWTGRNPVIVLGEQRGKTLMKDWNKTATKTITTSTVGDFVKASRSASTQQAAVDAMMKLA